MYLKVALRNLFRNKFYTVINIAGLSIGMAVAILIFSYVWFERSFDRFHSKSDQIYRIVQSTNWNGRQGGSAMTGHGLAPALRAEIPEILHITRMDFWPAEIEISNGEKKIIKPGGDNGFLYVDKDFFKIFDIEFIHGNLETALLDPNSIILIEEESKKLFSNENPIGKFIYIHQVVEEKVNLDMNLKVTGVVKAMPKNSHFEFKYLVSHEKNYRLKDAWPFVAGIDNTYLTLPVDFPIEDFESKFPNFIKKYFAPEIEKKISTSYDEWMASGGFWELKLQPLTEIRLNKSSYSEGYLVKKGNLFNVQIYTFIALLIIVLASINFITLSIALARKKAKEVGVRKVNGATRGQLIGQFLTESILLSIIALLFAMLIIRTFSEYFNVLLEISNSFSTTGITFIITAYFSMIIIIGVLAGSYSAFFLASYKPINVLKGQTLGKAKGKTFRNSLIVFQFIFSIVLMISSVMIYKQRFYIQNKNLGFEKANIVIIKGIMPMYYEEPKLSDKQRRLKFSRLIQEILKNSAVVNVTLMDAMPGNLEGLWTIDVHPEGTTPDSKFSITPCLVDAAYLDVFGLELKSGQNFKKELTNSQNMEGFIINEKAANLFGFKKPVGKIIEREISKRITTDEGKKKWVTVKDKKPIIGVFKDFHTQSLYGEITPILFIPQTRDKYFGFRIAVRFLPGNVSDNLGFLEKTWNNITVNSNFRYEFFDKELESKYHKEKILARILAFFTLLTIFIACLGIFGLATLMAEKKTKEIGVRKVNGATINEILFMLNKDFVKWVGIAFVIACPVSYYAMNMWLENFAYSTKLSWWVFALAGGFTLVIVLLTVSWQSYGAATRNPVKALRDE